MGIEKRGGGVCRAGARVDREAAAPCGGTAGARGRWMWRWASARRRVGGGAYPPRPRQARAAAAADGACRAARADGDAGQRPQSALALGILLAPRAHLSE